jgi:hypothetical protein
MREGEAEVGEVGCAGALYRYSGPPAVQMHEVTVGSSGCVEFLVAFGKLVGEVDDLLFELGDAALHLVGVVGRAESAVAPGLIAEEFGELVLQQPGFELLAGWCVRWR